VFTRLLRIVRTSSIHSEKNAMTKEIDRRAADLDAYFDMIRRMDASLPEEVRIRAREIVLVDAMCWAIQCGTPRGDFCHDLDHRLYDGFYRAVELNRSVPHRYKDFVKDRIELFDSYKFRRS